MPSVVFPAPDPSAIYWRREKENGQFEVASVQSLQRYASGSWRALFLVPGQAAFYINQHSPELQGWEPVFALTEDNLSAVVERVAQRVAELLTEAGSSASEVVEKAMEVVAKDTVEEAVQTAVGATQPEEDDGDGDFFVDSNYQKKKKKFVCGVCGKKYAYQKSLQKHIEKEHGMLALK